MMRRWSVCVGALWLALSGCTGDASELDGGRPERDAGVLRADGGRGSPDASEPDASSPEPRDASTIDAGPAPEGLSELLSEADFEALFPHRGDPACTGSIYTYDALLEAARTFPAFLTEGTADERRRELAAFLANIAHETTGGWPTAPGGPEAWGLCFSEEVGCSTAPPPACEYCVADARWPCAAGARYYGRGPIQLSYNYNYGQAGEALGVDLLSHPERVSADGVLAFRTALWFWMTAQPPKPSCHAVMTGQWTPSESDLALGRRPGFGMTVNIINGGIECSYAPGPAPANVANRYRFYAHFTAQMGVDPGPNVECGTMAHY